MAQQFIDYAKFMREGLPPHDSLAYPKALHHKMWQTLHGFAKHYGCRTCQPDFETMISGIHDVTSVNKLHRDPYDEKVFWKFYEMVEGAASRVAGHHGGKIPVETSEEGGGASYVGDDAFRRILPITDENVLMAIDHYIGEYKAPASVSDIQFLLSIPHGSPTDRAIDRALVKAPPDLVRRATEKLQQEGLVEASPSGGYVPTDKGRERLGLEKDFNILNGSDSLKMNGKDIGMIVGSELVAKGTEKLSDWVDATYNLDSQPLHLQTSTYVPIGGALLLLAAAKTRYFKAKPSRQLAAVVYASHLLSQGVDVAQQATAPGVQFGIVQVPQFPQSRIQPGLTPAPTPGYLPQLSQGVGGLRTIF